MLITRGCEKTLAEQQFAGDLHGKLQQSGNLLADSLISVIVVLVDKLSISVVAFIDKVAQVSANSGSSMVN